MSIYFLRHAKTVNNQRGIISGRIDSPLLNYSVIKTSESDICFDVVYISTAKRCLDTLKLGLQYFCYSEITETDLLLERDVGIIEGMTRNKAKKLYPDYFIGNKLDVNANLLNGESITDVKDRLIPLVEMLTPFKYSQKKCLVCSHNQTLKILYAILLDKLINNEFWKAHDFENGVIIKII